MTWLLSTWFKKSHRATRTRKGPKITRFALNLEQLEDRTLLAFKWVGLGADPYWSTQLNWTPVGIPGVTDKVIFDKPTPGYFPAPYYTPRANATFDAAFPGTIYDLELTDYYTGTITLKPRSGPLLRQRRELLPAVPW